MSNRESNEPEAMRGEYDFRGGERGRYSQRFAEGTNLAAIDADLALSFPDSAAVNRALRRYQQITRLIQENDQAG
jgi:hypothetical protein